ncbi:acetyltransferase [Streptomyces phage R4]|uniref:Acetyltransferase n=1 Tax=Streptomyces phage R4 TaxID=10732 RepID=K4I2T6_9CAUD|nr:acetyltransferase [Streptomyces phage R4]AFU62135.1 acetyltransferase [Streptomyces phage R4]
MSQPAHLLKESSVTTMTQTATVYVHPASWSEYTAALGWAREESPRIAEATSKPEEMPRGSRYYLTPDFKSGFGVAYDGTLIGLFSLVKGRGEGLMWDAVTHKGARRLDCFDGFLPEYYKRFGFVETERVPNWTPGQPDVVFMAL